MHLNITIQSVLSAMAYIDKNGVPPTREARTICVVHPNDSRREYPVKYLCEIAHNSINGNRRIEYDNFISHDAARALIDLGFKVIGFKK